MKSTNVWIFGRIIAAYVEVEAMKLDNEQRKADGASSFNYSSEDFFNKAQEIRDIAAELFK